MIARLMGLPTISPGEVQKRMQAGPLAVIDVNSRASWLAARVPGARHLDGAGFAAGDLPPDHDALLVFYCSGMLCRKAPNAARRAKGMGYHNVSVMSAGISGWMGAALPTQSGEPGET